MNLWDEWPARRKIDALVSAPQAGEAENGAAISGAVADFVERVASYAPEAFDEAVASVVRSILDSRPASAPLITLTNAVLLVLDRGPDTVIAEARSVAERLRTSVGILAAMGAVFVPDGGSVLVHGTSSSVRRVLENAAVTKRFRVTCEPGEDRAGIAYAADLASAGISVEVVDSDFVIGSLLGIDLVVTGAFAFGSDTVVVSEGTRAIVEEAAGLDLRVLMVSSADKALPAVLYARAVAASADLGLEVVDLSLFEAVVTELGVLDPAAAGRLADRREIARELV